MPTHKLTTLAPRSQKAKGVSILIGKQVPWTLKEQWSHWSDTEDRTMFVKGQIGARTYTLAALYAPNTAQIQFLEDMLNKLESFTEGTLILGGDLNLVLDPS